MKGLEVIGSYLDEWNIVTITVRLILAVVCGGAITTPIMTAVRPISFLDLFIL